MNFKVGRRTSTVTVSQARAMSGIRILVVASVRLFREGLTQILDRREGLTVVGAARNRAESLARILEINPQIVLLDITDAESHALAREIGRMTPQVRVVALGVVELEGNVLACAEAGVAEYVSRDGSLEGLVAAIKSAACGEVHCSPQQAGSLWRRLATLAANQRQAAAIELTRREREVVRLIECDLSNKEIARQLGIEVATVKNHVHNLLDKLQVDSRVKAAAFVRAAPGRGATQRAESEPGRSLLDAEGAWIVDPAANYSLMDLDPLTRSKLFPKRDDDARSCVERSRRPLDRGRTLSLLKGRV